MIFLDVVATPPPPTTRAHVTPASENGSLESIDPGVRLALSRLIAWSPHALCVCDMRVADQPIIFANDNFFIQTGYSPEDVINRNCRFLQGPNTAAETVKKMSSCIRNGEEFSVRRCPLTNPPDSPAAPFFIFALFFFFPGFIAARVVAWMIILSSPRSLLYFDSATGWIGCVFLTENLTSRGGC